jgi:hypothetical protein
MLKTVNAARTKLAQIIAPKIGAPSQDEAIKLVMRDTYYKVGIPAKEHQDGCHCESCRYGA